MEDSIETKPGRLPRIDTAGLESFIPDHEIVHHLENTVNPEKERVREIIDKSLAKNRLDPEEVATLLNVTDPELLERIFEGARRIKEQVYGNRIVLFAPLYVGNECVNNCSYCGFRKENVDCVRTTLSMEELGREVEAVVESGHKRVIMVYGEHGMYSPEFIAETVGRVYDVQKGSGEIRRININAAPLDVDGFKTVKSANIGTYQIFQETYHRETYEKVHPSGPKSDFLWRLFSLDRAMEAGIDDVGIGALMGLHDWRFEVMGLLCHTIHLEERYGVGPHTISFPRIEPAIGSVMAAAPPSGVSDDDFKHLVAVLRLAVPYTGLILTARESVAVRNEVLPLGVSQIDAGSSIGIGSYASKTYASEDQGFHEKSQFMLGDNRTLDEIIHELCRAGYIPSFCTGCYRLGRTGEHFMEFAVPGFVKRFCSPNAVLTFLEYLKDYAGPETRKAGRQCIEKELERIGSASVKQVLLKKMEAIEKGERDIFL